MTHSELLKKVAQQCDVKPKMVDKIVELYFLEVAKAAQGDLEEKRENLEDKALLTRSSSIINRNVGSFWVKYDKGEDGENALGGQEKAFYPRLKVRFSKAFNEKAFVEPKE